MNSSKRIVRKPIVNFKGLYAVDSSGNVIALPKEWFSGKGGNIKQSKPERILKPSIDKNGYRRVTLMKDGQPYYYRVCRLICAAFHDNRNNFPQVNHKDGNKANDCSDNLEWVTDIQNKRHAWETGLQKPSVKKKGEENTSSKLTNEQADEIRESELSYRKLAEMYGVHHSIIGRIKKGTSYPKK